MHEPEDPIAWREQLQGAYGSLVAEHLAIEDRLGDVAAYALRGGKHVRPVIAEAMGEALGAPPAAVRRVALAVEYLHAASLLLDDLPAMDHAEERRGVPAAHARFSEAEAILASIALVARSYAIVLGDEADDAGRGRSMALLVSQTIGGGGMAGGQARELALEPSAGEREVEAIHLRKTAVLFALIPRLIASAVDADEAALSPLVQFATLFGSAYQITDDLRDREIAGEHRGNLACVIGVDAARSRARDFVSAARSAVAPLGERSRRLDQCAAWLGETLDATP